MAARPHVSPLLSGAVPSRTRTVCASPPLEQDGGGGLACVRPWTPTARPQHSRGTVPASARRRMSAPERDRSHFGPDTVLYDMALACSARLHPCPRRALDVHTHSTERSMAEPSAERCGGPAGAKTLGACGLAGFGRAPDPPAQPCARPAQRWVVSRMPSYSILFRCRGSHGAARDADGSSLLASRR